MIAEIANTIDEAAKRFQWVASLSVACLAIYAVVLAMDRDAPFVVMDVRETVAERGQEVVLEAAVHRDIERRCEATISRYLFASDGARYDLGASIASSEMIASIERITPGKLRVVIRVPERIAPGRAVLQSVLSYRCNKVQALWPIIVTTELPFTVL